MLGDLSRHLRAHFGEAINEFATMCHTRAWTNVPTHAADRNGKPSARKLSGDLISSNAVRTGACQRSDAWQHSQQR